MDWWLLPTLIIFGALFVLFVAEMAQAIIPEIVAAFEKRRKRRG